MEILGQTWISRAWLVIEILDQTWISRVWLGTKKRSEATWRLQYNLEIYLNLNITAVDSLQVTYILLFINHIIISYTDFVSVRYRI